MPTVFFCIVVNSSPTRPPPPPSSPLLPKTPSIHSPHHPTPPLHNPLRPSPPPKHHLQIPRDTLRTLPRRKMAAPFIHPLQHHLPHPPSPTNRMHIDIPREICQPQFHTRHIPPRLLHQPHPTLHMRALTVNAHTSRRPRGRENIDRHPSQNLIVAPTVRIRPVVQFFVDPG